MYAAHVTADNTSNSSGLTSVILASCYLVQWDALGVQAHTNVYTWSTYYNDYHLFVLNYASCTTEFYS